MFRRLGAERRGDRLHRATTDLFTGEVWTGARAVELGLVDGLGTARGVLAERFPDAELVPVEGRKPLLARLGLGLAPAAAATLGPDRLLGHGAGGRDPGHLGAVRFVARCDRTNPIGAWPWHSHGFAVTMVAEPGVIVPAPSRRRVRGHAG